MTDRTITLAPGETLTITGASPADAAPAPDPAPAPEAATTPAAPAEATAPAPANPSEADLAAQAQAQAAAAMAQAAGAAVASGSDGTYTVQPGDTLDSIASAIYGPEAVDAALFEANTAVLGSDPSAPLAPGTVLVVPALTIDPAPAAPAS